MEKEEKNRKRRAIEGDKWRRKWEIEIKVEHGEKGRIKGNKKNKKRKREKNRKVEKGTKKYNEENEGVQNFGDGNKNGDTECIFSIYSM